MNKMLLAVFDNETAAFAGLKALKDLHDNGDITLYSWAVVARDKAGKIELKQQDDRGPVGTALGMLTGTLIGLLGGPAGAVIGASLGGLSGLFFDLDNADVGVGFYGDVVKTLTPGKTAVLADLTKAGQLRSMPGCVSMAARFPGAFAGRSPKISLSAKALLWMPA